LEWRDYRLELLELLGLLELLRLFQGLGEELEEGGDVFLVGEGG
jgi:hypothetical protein